MVSLSYTLAYTNGMLKCTSEPSTFPRGSKHPICEVSGPKKSMRVWFLEPEASNTGYLDPLGFKTLEDLRSGLQS